MSWSYCRNASANLVKNENANLFTNKNWFKSKFRLQAAVYEPVFTLLVLSFLALDQLLVAVRIQKFVQTTQKG